MRTEQNDVQNVLQEMLSKIQPDTAPRRRKPRQETGIATDLLTNYQLFTERNEFRPGDLVTWKSEAMRTRKFPEPNKPAVVIEVLETPVYDQEHSNSSGRPLFREPLDIVLGIIDESDGDFMLFHCDKRPLKHWIPEDMK